jgi:hypothetical protein
MDFCYLARRSLLTEDTLNEMDNALARFHREREIFRTLSVRTDFNLPRQHSLIHYRRSIQQFGAPNGLCSSMTKNKHIKAVKEPWRRSNRYNALGQMLVTNQRIDKLAAARLDFVERGLLPPPRRPSNQPRVQVNENGEDVDGPKGIGEVRLSTSEGV